MGTAISRLGRKYGWKPQLPDHRDLKFRPTAMELPQVVDMRPSCPPIEDQGQLGSCTANAWAGALEFLELKDGKPLTPLSRLFLYWKERALEGDVGQDNGAALRDGAKALATKGICKESMWPYDISKFAVQAPPACWKDAANHTIKSYHAINQTLTDMLTCLAQGYPFVLGFSVYASFESDQVAATGIVPMPRPGEELLGGHAVCIVGYNQSTKYFLARNSWGISWGLHGYFWIPFTYLCDEDLANDLWTVRTAKNM